MASLARDCILLSTADWYTPYWTNKQHTARTMARRGWRVLYVESVGLRGVKAGSARDWSRLARRLRDGVRSALLGPRQVGPGIWVLSPLAVPGAASPILRGFNSWMLGWAIRRFRRSRNFARPLVWTYHPFVLDVGALKPREGLVYHYVDDLSAVPGVDPVAFRQAEDALLKVSDFVFATAHSLAKRAEMLNPRTWFLPNVADAGHFGGALDARVLPADIASIPEPRLVYHGVLSDFKFDAQLLAHVAREHPEWQFIIIGEEREGQHSQSVEQLRRLENAHLIGHRDYASLPDYLAAMSVGLLPTVNNAYTRGMFPMKFYEYLAAGLPVASTPVAFTNGTHQGLEIGGGAEGFAAAIERQLARGRLTRAEAEAAVGDNTWERRMDRMERLLDSNRVPS